VGTVVAENLPPNLLQRSFSVMALGLGGGTRQPVDFYFSSIQRSVLNTLAPLALRTLWLDYQIDQIERELLSTSCGVLAMRLRRNISRCWRTSIVGACLW
jgi:hypothetical protein